MRSMQCINEKNMLDKTESLHRIQFIMEPNSRKYFPLINIAIVPVSMNDVRAPFSSSVFLYRCSSKNGYFCVINHENEHNFIFHSFTMVLFIPLLCMPWSTFV